MTRLCRSLHRLVLAAAVCAGVAGRVAAQGAAPTPTSPAWGVITYLSGATAYLEIGTKHGVAEGTVFSVIRRGLVVGELTATFVSSSRTACTINAGSPPFAVGDSVRYRPVRAAVAPAMPDARASTPSPRRGGRRAPIRGRVGIRYLTVSQQGGGTLHQPSIDLRLDGTEIAGGPLGVAVDVRMHRSSVSGGSSTSPTGATRVYQAALLRQRGVGGTRLAVGRQFATALSPIGIFDGIALDLQGPQWSGGGLVGTMPDAATFAPSSNTSEAGFWVQRHNRPGSPSPWSATVGVIGSYNRGKIDREFLYLRGTWSSRTLSLYVAEELDINRGWKREVEGAFTTFTSTLVTTQVTVSRALSVSAGMDSRRSVRLYRDFVNPEAAFDDALRQGTWGEISIRPSRHLRVSTDIRTNGGGSEGRSQAMTASFSAMQLTSLGLGLRARTTQYQGALTEGRLSSVAIEVSPSQAIRLALNGGLRTSRSPDLGGDASRLTWTGADVDLALGRSLYLMLSTYRESGLASASVQSYGAVTWRF